MLHVDNVRKGFFEHDQFTAVRAVLSEELRPVQTFAYYTGCRKGGDSDVAVVEVWWPSGAHQEIKDVRADQFLEVREPERP